MQEEKECHDCKKTLEHGDLYMPYQANGEEIVKCKACHEKDPTCRNFQPTEVYTRVVGYIRPVQQWNKGKRQEYEDRKEYRAENNMDSPLRDMKTIQEEIEKITDEYGQLHETDCDLNSEDGSFDGCTCAMKSLSNEVVGRLIEYFSHDIFDNEEQRKAGVELYREGFGLNK